MIEYDFIEGRRGTWKVNVKLDGKIVGAIKLVEGGFRYFPRGGGKGFAGELFKTVREVQADIEGRNNDQIPAY